MNRLHRTALHTSFVAGNWAAIAGMALRNGLFRTLAKDMPRYPWMKTLLRANLPCDGGMASYTVMERKLNLPTVRIDIPHHFYNDRARISHADHQLRFKRSARRLQRRHSGTGQPFHGEYHGRPSPGRGMSVLIAIAGSILPFVIIEERKRRSNLLRTGKLKIASPSAQ